MWKTKLIQNVQNIQNFKNIQITWNRQNKFYDCSKSYFAYFYIILSCSACPARRAAAALTVAVTANARHVHSQHQHTHTQTHTKHTHIHNYNWHSLMRLKQWQKQNPARKIKELKALETVKIAFAQSARPEDTL